MSQQNWHQHPKQWTILKPPFHTNRSILIVNNYGLCIKMKTFDTLAHKVEKKSQTDRCQCLTSTFGNSSGHTALEQIRPVGKATITNGLCLRRSQVLSSLRHYLWAQSQGHHTIDHTEERSMARGSAHQSSLKGQERVMMNIGTVSKATLGKLPRDGVKCVWAFPST